MADNRLITVIGGTSGTGLLIVKLLQAKGVPVRVLARHPERAARRLGSGVEIVQGDLTQEHTLPAIVKDSSAIIVTAGVPSGHVAGEALVKATDYQGVLNTLAAARVTGFEGRFLYMTSIGVGTPSIAGSLLNLIKGKTLAWRYRLEDVIRRSGLDYTIVRAGFLTNAPPGRRAVELSQNALPLAPRYRIARADVAELFVAALDHPKASHTTLEAVSRKGQREDWNTLLSRLSPDA